MFYEDHKKFIGKPFYDLCDGLTETERTLLVKYGAWLEALATNLIKAYTPAQGHFVRFVQGEVSAENDYERAWKKVVEARRRRTWELCSPRAEISKENLEKFIVHARTDGQD